MNGYTQDTKNVMYVEYGYTRIELETRGTSTAEITQYGAIGDGWMGTWGWIDRELYH